MRVPFRLPLLVACLSLGVSACGPQQGAEATALQASSQATHEDAHAPQDAEAAEVGEDGHTPTCASPKKVLLCHVPPGNPANAHEVCVGYPSKSAHLAHSTDYLGACQRTQEPDTGEETEPDGGEEPGGEEPVCRSVGEACTTDAECCTVLNCITGYCTVLIE